MKLYYVYKNGSQWNGCVETDYTRQQWWDQVGRDEGEGNVYLLLPRRPQQLRSNHGIQATDKG